MKRLRSDKGITCHVCHETGHYGRECPLLPKIQELVSEGSLTKYGLKRTYAIYHPHATLTARTDSLGQFDVLLDRQSNINAFHNEELLTKLLRVPDLSLGGMAEGRHLTSNRVGRVKGIDFGEVYFFPGAAAFTSSQGQRPMFSARIRLQTWGISSDTIKTSGDF